MCNVEFITNTDKSYYLVETKLKEKRRQNFKQTKIKIRIRS